MGDRVAESLKKIADWIARQGGRLGGQKYTYCENQNPPPK
jgi:hypothetical protein